MAWGAVQGMASAMKTSEIKLRIAPAAPFFE
jgi:hypothetical protein